MTTWGDSEPLPAVRVCPVDGCDWTDVSWTTAAVTDATLRRHLRERHTVTDFLISMERQRAQLVAAEAALVDARAAEKLAVEAEAARFLEVQAVRGEVEEGRRAVL